MRNPAELKLAALLFAAAAPVALADTTPSETKLESTSVEWIRDPAMVPYADAYRYFDAYAQCPRMAPRFKVLHSDKFDIHALRVELVGPNTDIEVPVDAERRTIEVPRDEAALGDKAEFMLNQKPGTVDVRVDAVVRLPSARELHYRDLMDAIAEANRCEKAVVPFAIRMVRKDYTGLRLRFAEAARLEIQDATAQTIDTDEKNVLALALDPALYARNPTIVLSTLPREIEPAHVKLAKGKS